MSAIKQLQDFIPQKLQISDSALNLHHIFEEADCYALWAAYAAGRPLLVRGQPGTGKSQMARAIAQQLGWAFVSETVRGNTELNDLHWQFDAIGRLGEAQARAHCQPPKAGEKDPLDPLNFLSPGVFWWAFNWRTAEQRHQPTTSHARPKPYAPKDWSPEAGGVVLLLDEIDKAEPDLPNGLLETLGSLQFSVPYLPEKDGQNPIQADPQKLLIIITTNEERELPKAFMRRCFVHTLHMETASQLIDPHAEQPIEKRWDWLMQRGRLHFGTDIAETAYLEAAKQLWQDRDQDRHSPYPPGLAEYIDLLQAIKNLSHDEQIGRLHKIAPYALDKQLTNRD